MSLREEKLKQLIKTFEENNLYFTEDELKKNQENIFKLNVDYKTKCKLLKENMVNTRKFEEFQKHYPSVTKNKDVGKIFKFYELYKEVIELL